MQHFFTLLLLCSTFFTLSAQHVNITKPAGEHSHPPQPPESACNFAGTVSFGQFIGQSNDVSPDRVFLCLGDSLLIQHNGDADLSGDPAPGTPPGVAMAFYTCPPTLSGDDLISITLTPGDPCLLGGAGILLTTEGFANGGDTWFFNNSQLQAEYNSGQPLELFFAPITVDDWVQTAYEAVPGCVNVNVDEAFPVVYLNPIVQNQVDNMLAGNKCIGKFRINGGYPQYDQSATYDIDIALEGQPSEKAILHLPESQWLGQTFILFSVTTPGKYLITAEDGKSCGLQFEMDMSGCVPDNNIRFQPDSVDALPGDTVCIPIRVSDFEVVSAVFSIHWDETLLQYLNYQDLHPNIATFFNPAEFLNPSQTSQGKLGISLYDLSWPGTVIDIPENESLLSLCFQVLDTLNTCSPVVVDADPSILAFENEQGFPLAITSIPGQVCPGEIAVSSVKTPLDGRLQLQPNPVQKGQTLLLSGLTDSGSAVAVVVRDAQGAVIARQFNLPQQQGSLELNTGQWPAGVYFVEIQQDGRAAATVKLVVLD